jgi:hypothetical protein
MSGRASEGSEIRTFSDGTPTTIELFNHEVAKLPLRDRLVAYAQVMGIIELGLSEVEDNTMDDASVDLLRDIRNKSTMVHAFAYKLLPIEAKID